ncbi:unnamed protein product [Triticum turgidum subsp. durum]|uniref:Uncharacterized protein n=1 Tax=Triticum turgidum subsp. durum TaxID=4567 RepID=A0A9R1QVD2_TRITD|nr:unnamed protein product [Triticum turgidum subsp. durum]
MIPNLSGLRPREPLRHRRGRQRRLRRPLLRRHRRPARPRIPNRSALKNHFGAAAAGSDDFGGLFSADQLALEFPTCNHFDGFQQATKEMANNKKGTTTLSFISDKASSSPPTPGPAWAGTHVVLCL